MIGAVWRKLYPKRCLRIDTYVHNREFFKSRAQRDALALNRMKAFLQMIGLQFLSSS